MFRWIAGVGIAAIVGVGAVFNTVEAAPRTYTVNGVTVSLIEENYVYGKGFEVFSDFAFDSTVNGTSAIYNEAGSTTLGGTPIYVGDIINRDGTQPKQFFAEIDAFTSGTANIRIYGSVGTATQWHLIGSTTLGTATGTYFIDATDHADLNKYYNYLTAGLISSSGTMTVTLTGSCAARKN
jgi:hypothetical protein